MADLPQTSQSDRNATILGVQALNAIVQALGKIFPQTSGTSTSAVGGAITPPAQVVGYITVTLESGQSVKVPYFD